MEDEAQSSTLEALTAYIERQKTLLAQTQVDLQRLRGLKGNGIDLQTLSQVDVLEVTPLSALEGHFSSAPNEINWDTFRDRDPRPLQNLAVAEQVAYASRNQPHTNQRTSLSSLQNYVKNARKSIVEPVLSALEPMSDTENEDLSRKPSIRSYIHAYRARPTYASSGLTVASRPRDNTGQVIWRSNVKEENTDALVSIEAQDEVPTIGKSLSHYASPSPPPLPPPISKPATSKTRRPKIKSKSRAPVSSPTSIPRKSVKPEGKADSYKQAWSVSEQDLLERLLEEIPDGSKNRWKQISLAMNGRRTPRQVASRVQKYFEKLKRFGLSTDPQGDVDDE